ncbi:hypothetical protein [Allosphingosinicella humi]
MIFNASIDADDPRRVALILAEIIGGRAGPFAAIGEGSWVAVAGDGFGTMIEVYQRGTELHRAPVGLDVYGLAGMPRGNGAFHLALGTELSAAQVHAIGAREGWPTQYCRRGGAFGVIELWIDDRFMIEVLTIEMQREYIDTISIASLADLGTDPSRLFGS